MAKPDSRVTDYIGKAQPFAQPILSHIRELWDANCPDGEEAIKWGMPAMTYKGRNVSGMAAFKEHATLGFWYGKLVTGGTGFENAAMGSFGRIASLDDLPDDEALGHLIRKSVELIDAGVKPPQFSEKKPPKGALETPPALAAALAGNRQAQATFESFAPSHRREYCEWVSEAKRDETRDKRVAQAVEWLAQGKKRNWKYENC